jgi:hypothetical protein
MMASGRKLKWYERIFIPISTICLSPFITAYIVFYIIGFCITGYAPKSERTANKKELT